MTSSRVHPVPEHSAADAAAIALATLAAAIDACLTKKFVIESLRVVFDIAVDIAVELTQTIHTEGSATVALLPYEMAEQKGVEATQLARANGFPLVIKLEPDTK